MQTLGKVYRFESFGKDVANLMFCNICYTIGTINILNM